MPYENLGLTFLFRIFHNDKVVKNIDDLKKYVEITQMNRFTDLSDDLKEGEPGVRKFRASG